MKTRFQIQTRAIVGLLVVTSLAALGCSDQVSFQTTNPDDQRVTRGQAKSESFTQGVVSKKLDILFIVDNSTSMYEEQEKLGERISSFLSTLVDVDWQLAITTTDVSNGKYGMRGDLLTFNGTNSHVLNKNVPNYEKLFKETIVRRETIDCTSECPSGDEQALRAAIMAMQKRETTNSGFFRNDADLGLLVLSDEDEMSDGPLDATQPEEVLQTFNGAWSDSKQLLTYGMIIVPGDNGCMNSQGPSGGAYGRSVNRLASLSKGLVGSICANDYAPTLGLLANHARNLLDYVQLKYYPTSQNEVKITFDPQHETDFTLEGRRIRFAKPPAKGTKIQVDYIVK